MRKRIFSFIMALLMVFTMLPVEAIALTTDDGGNAVYEIGDTVWVKGEDGEPTGATVADAFWLPVYDDSDQPVTKQGLCELAEHTHSYVCAADCALAHSHGEQCYTTEYVGCTAHEHNESCVTKTVYDCGLAEHANHDGCTASQVCTIEEHDHAAAQCQTQVSFTCAVEEHDHVTAGCAQDESGNYTCGKTAHTHSVENGCSYENTFTCGKENHIHVEGEGSTCVMTTVYSCGLEIHTHEACASHTEYEGCTAHAHSETCTTEQKLSCTLAEHTCITEGCAADCAIAEHTHTAECDMEGVYYQWIVVEDTSSDFAGESAAITLSSNSTYSQKYVVVYDASGNYVGYYYVNSSYQLQTPGGSTAAFEAGTYTIYYGPGGHGRNKTVYKGTATVAEGGTAATASMSSVRFSQQTDAEKIKYAGSMYYNSSNFNHIHVRVEGSYVVNIGGTSVTATVSNPMMVVYVDGTKKIEHTWSESASYEWTYETSVSPSSLIDVELTVDLTYTDATGTHTMEDVTITYDNVNDLQKFWEAIAICDGVEGLDFTVSVEDIQEEMEYYTVQYEWRVYNTDGTYTTLPAGAPSAPASESGIQENTEYVYNTSYVTGSTFPDYENGLLYTFQGWDTWSHSDVFNVDIPAQGYTALDDGDTDASNNQTIPITADTYIYGYWKVTEMEPENAHVALAKNIVGLDDDAAALAQAEKLWFQIDPGYDMDGDGVSRVDVDYGMIKADADGEYKIPVYQYDIPFVFTENDADVPGYTRTTVISTTGTNVSLVAEDGTTVTGDTGVVAINPEFAPSDESYHLGTVTYTNTYTKKTGEDIHVYPQLTLWKTDEVPTSLAGAVFTLYRNEACTEEHKITSYTTDAEGHLYINFADAALGAGTYYLKETVAPEGYVPDSTVYTVTVTAKETKEELRDGVFHNVTYYTLSVTFEGDNAVFSTTASQALETSTDYYRLHVYNNPITADLKLSKAAKVGQSDMPDADKANLSASVIVRGPITRNEDGEITALGGTYNVTLNSANSWEATLKNLAYGEYLIHESFASVHGYTWKDVAYTENDTALQTYTYNDMVYVLFDVADTSPISVDLTNTYEEWTSADFYIKKVNAAGNTLAGATFQLYTDAACTEEASGSFTTSATTDEYGYAWFQGFVAPESGATYYLKETKAPAGYYLSSTIYKVEIKAVTDATADTTTYEADITVLGDGDASFDSTTDLLTVTNSPVLGQLTVTKQFKDKEGNTIAPPQGLTSVTATVSGTGYTNTVTLNEDNNWTVALNNLPLGTYTVTEQNANVPGYTLVTTYKVGDTETAQITLAESNPGYTAEGTVFGGDSEIINTYTRNEEFYEIPTMLRVKKVGEDGTTGLPGAVFTLERYDTSGENIISSTSFTTNSDGVVEFDMLAGFIVNGKPVDGKFVLSETKAPDGYAKTDTTWTVTITEKDGEYRIVLNEDKNIFENFWDWIVGNITGKQDTYTFVGADAEKGTPATLTVKNMELADMTITKSFVDQNGNAVTPPAGAIIEVSVLDANGKLYEEVELTADNGWKYTVMNMPAGKYTVTEATASLHGYTWTGADLTVKGAESKAGTYANSVEVTVVDSAEIGVAVKNKYTVWETADFWVLKTTDDGDTPLAGAIFELYDANNQDVTDQYLDKSITGENETGVRGVVHFQGFTVPAEDEDGIVTYYLKETKAPENYYRSETVYKVTVSHDSTGYNVTITDKDGNAVKFNTGNDVLTVVNEEILGDLTIQKTFEGSDLIPGYVRVDVTGPNGYKETVTLTANTDPEKNWVKTLENLHLGEYTIAEQDASQDGYNLTVSYSTEKVTLTAANDSDKVVDVTINNTYKKNANGHTPASFEILKVGEDGKTPLAGAKFTLSAEGFDDIVVTTNDEGKAVFNNLTGKIVNDKPVDVVYTLTETEAPDGYVSIDTEWEITVKEDDGAYRIVLNKDNNLFENIWDWITGNTNASGDGWTWTDGVLTVQNTTIKGKLTVEKAFVNGDTALSDDITKNARVELHVHGPIVRDGNNNITSIGPLVQTITLPEDDASKWEAVVENLEIGEYVLREPFASIHGYTWNSASYKINGQNVALETYNGMKEFAAFSVTGETEEPAISVELTNSYTVWTAADFYINKVKDIDDLTAGLAGATFQLYTKDAEGNYVEVPANDQFTTTATTGIAGYAHFTGFTVPEDDADHKVVYYLKETGAPDDYYLTTNVWMVEIGYDTELGTYTTNIDLVEGTTADAEWIWNGERDVLDVENTKIQGSLTISKSFGTGNELIPAEIKVNVTGPNDYSETVTLKNGGWSQTLTGLELGEYKIVEVDAAHAGYTLTTTYYEGETAETTAYAEVVLDEGNNRTAGYIPAVAVKIENIYDKQEETVENPASFEVLKVDKNGTALAGAEFTLTDPNGNKVVQTTGEDGKAAFSGLKGTIENGVAKDAVYTLTETKAPAGYVKTNTSWTVVVQEDDGKVTVKLNSSKNVFENIWDWIIGSNSTGTWDADMEVLTVTNEKTKLTIDKAFAYALDGVTVDKKTGMTVPETEFTFKVTYGDVVKEVSINLGDKDTSNDTAVVEGIPVGTEYTVEEVTSGAHFTSSKESGTMPETGVAEETVTNTYKFFTVSAKKIVEVKGVSVDEKVTKQYFNREYTFVLNVDAKPVETMKLKHDQTGTFQTILPVGTDYVVVEDYEENALYVPSTNLADNTTTITNTYTFVAGDPLVIDMVKVDSGKKRVPLAGAKFSLYNEEGDLEGYYTSAKDGTFVIDEIDEPGTYKLKETKAPDGYNKLSKAITIEADYQYTVKTVDGKPVIVRTLVATVSGGSVYERTDGAYGIKNTQITDNPKTGDQFNMGLWLGIGGIAAVVLIVLLILGKKKGKK